MKRSTKIALITSGGDCQGLNAAIRGVGKSLFQRMDNVEIYGMYDGYRGLIEGDYKYMEPQDLSGILTEGGTILGTSRQNYVPGKDIVDDKGNSVIPSMLQTYNRLNLDCLVIMGGNGTQQKSAKLIADAGMNVITLPKTIDNDIWGTDTTFGFQSAVDIATNVIDYIHSTASSHSRIFVVELMGRDAGWLTLNAGIGSGADVILIPEIPYDLNKVAEAYRGAQPSGQALFHHRLRRRRGLGGRYQATRRPAAASARTAGTPPSPMRSPTGSKAHRQGSTRHRARALSARRSSLPV